MIDLIDWFSLTSNSVQNSYNGKIRRHLIESHTQINQIIMAVNSSIGQLREQDDDASIQLKWNMWDLRQSIVHAVVEFDDDSLLLDTQFINIKSKSLFYPVLKNNINVIERSLSQLLEDAHNPKQSILEDLLIEAELNDITYALVFPPVKGRLIGWSDQLLSRIKHIAENCAFIDSRKAISSKSFDKIILASGGAHLSYFYELIYSGASRLVDIITYDREKFQIPEKKKLPKGSFNIIPASTISQEVSSSISDSKGSCYDGISDDDCWSSLSKVSLNQREYSDQEYNVKARLIELSDGGHLFLKDDQKVTEISDILHGLASLEDYGKRFPRKQVTSLEDGDYILLRTHGSGDYLVEIADKLIKKDKKQGLRQDALSWKPRLKAALEKYGVSLVHQKLAEKGHSLSFKEYIWQWTTDEVMSPGTDSRFFELIGILSDLGQLSDVQDIVGYATKKWESMIKLKQYHAKAGNYIRRMLLNKLKEMIGSGNNIRDGYELRLDGVESGSMTVYLVSDVDPITHIIPYSDLNTITRRIN